MATTIIQHHHARTKRDIYQDVASARAWRECAQRRARAPRRCGPRPAFHELGHWTGHKSRLDRDLRNRFGEKAYAAEELIAELCAAFLCAEFSIDGGLRHAGYIASWIGLLKADSRAFFTAASRAQAAADYLRGVVLADDAQAQAA
jgi:antirestriction protein ArdC